MPTGIAFPKPAGGGKVSSTPHATATLAAAVSVFSDLPGVNVEDFQKRIGAQVTKVWRTAYVDFFKEQVKLMLQHGEQRAVSSAEAGLDFIRDLLEFELPDGTRIPLGVAMDPATPEWTDLKYYGAKIVGGAAQPETHSIPYQERDSSFSLFSHVGRLKGDKKHLTGDKLMDRIKTWIDFGTVEPSCMDAIQNVLSNPQWTDLQGKVFVVLGAGSAMGPLPTLLAMGATVVAVDLDRPKIWEKIIAYARTTPGTLIVPQRTAPTHGQSDAELCATAGCNLLSETPQIAHWLTSLFPDQPMTVGCYAYADGERHVRIAVAMDYIVTELIKRRKAPVNLAYLCSPIDIFAVPKEIRDMGERVYQEDKYSSGRLVPAPLTLAVNSRYPNRMMDRHYDEASGGKTGFTIKGSEDKWWVCDVTLLQQGPNYMLAKRLQQWRAIVARNKQRCVVSSNVAPSSRTQSVMSNAMFAGAYRGCYFYRPVEIFDTDTSNSLMTFLLLNDIYNDKSPAHPDTKLQTPLQLFALNSMHGGMWRLGVKLRSALEMCVAMDLLDRFKIPVGAVVLSVLYMTSRTIMSRL